MPENNNYNKNNTNIVNPFSPQYPAVPNCFVNRSIHLERFVRATKSSAKAQMPAPINFLILGDWGMGKTSLLNKMHNIVANGLDGVKIFSFYLALDPNCCESWEKFCLVFLSQLKKHSEGADGISKKLRGELQNWKFSVNFRVLAIERAKEDEKNKVISLVETLEEFWMKYLKPSGVELGLFFLDDIQYFLRGKSPDAYFTLRNNFQELARRNCNFSLIATGPEILVKDTDIAEPFVRFFEQRYLEPFDLEGTKKAIVQRLAVNRLRLKLTDEVIATIYQKTRGHPYFIMFIMYELLNLSGSIKLIDDKKFNGCWPTIFSRIENNVFSNQLRGVSEKELETLIKIANINEPTISPSMVKMRGANEFFKRLESKGLLIKKERGQYELFHPLFKDHLIKQIP